MITNNQDYRNTLDETAMRLVWDAIDRKDEVLAFKSFKEVGVNVNFIANFFGTDEGTVEKDLASAMKRVNVKDLYLAKVAREKNLLH